MTIQNTGNNVNSFNSVNNGYGSGINGMEFGNNGLIDTNNPSYGYSNNGYQNNLIQNMGGEMGNNNFGGDNAATNEDINYVTNALNSVNINGYGNNNNNYGNFGGGNIDFMNNNYGNNNFNGNFGSNNFGNFNGQENFIPNNLFPNNNEETNGMEGNGMMPNSYGNYKNMFGNGLIKPPGTGGSMLNIGNGINGEVNYGDEFMNGENNIGEYSKGGADFDPKNMQRYNEYLNLINQKYGITVTGGHPTPVKNLPPPSEKYIGNELNSVKSLGNLANSVIGGTDELPSKTGSLGYGSFIQPEQNQLPSFYVLNGGESPASIYGEWQPTNFEYSNNQESTFKMPNYQSTSSIQALTQQVFFLK